MKKINQKTLTLQLKKNQLVKYLLELVQELMVVLSVGVKENNYLGKGLRVKAEGTLTQRVLRVNLMSQIQI